MTTKHNGFADDVTRLRLKRDKIIAQLCRAEMRLTTAIRAVARSTKRIDKERQLQVNTPLPPVDFHARARARSAAETLPDKAALTELDALEAFNRSPVKPLPGLETKPKARKARRTPDDFKAEMKARKKPVAEIG